MASVSLVATMAYAYAGHPLAIGDTFDASPSDARVLTLLGRARLNDRLVTEVFIPEPPQDISVVEAVESVGAAGLEELNEEPAAVSEAPKPKRQYRRRHAESE